MAVVIRNWYDKMRRSSGIASESHLVPVFFQFLQISGIKNQHKENANKIEEKQSYKKKEK